MSRSGYTDDGDYDELAMGRWRGQVRSAMRGKRGQALLRDLVAALDAMPEKRLVRGALEDEEGSVCALGAVCKKRGVPMPKIEYDDAPEDWSGTLGATLDIAEQLAAEVMHVNDEWGPYNQTPEGRWQTVRQWAAGQLERVDREAAKKASANVELGSND